MLPEIHVSRKEFDEMKIRLEKTETMIEALFEKLMVPQPGQERSLLDRAAMVTNDIESGKRGARFVLGFLGFMAAIGITVHFGPEVADKIK
jgi:hypothetical protein